ncbi:MAG TPA: N,N-dimethylformamidase beta subunit family domain-containing protein, partial [Acidimicrobiia bacterium]|nr:N,N-dimethylformamidase beta subunit family domain-containing protein [Acidimicrobiia bacterium]
MQSVTSRRARPRRSRHLRRALLIAATIMLVGGIATFALIPEHGETPSVAPPAHVVITTTTTHPRPIDHRNAIQRENARPGTTSWHIRPLTIFGPSAYADHVSAQHGDEVTLYVTSVMPTFSVEGYRMGWYQGTGARLVWRSPPQRARTQPDGRLLAETRTFTTHWTPSLHLTVPASWLPGDYLLKVSDANGDTYVPLTVRDDRSHAPVLVVNAVTTWQAYNDYGGYSLYHGPGLNARTRSTVVTFDRPYSRDGAGDFIANELGLVALAERMGLDVTYTTDIDLHEHPELLTNHKVIISLGHDEYWSKTMRDGVEAARDKGVNVMFLGANALYRRIRLDPSPLGPDRLEVNYRTVAGDTYYQQTKQEPTTEWRAAPQARPESSLTGTFYECNPVNVDGVVADASSWVFAGTGLHNGDHLKLLIGTEYDRVTAGVPTPPDIEVLLHSPLRCGGRRSFADAAYYTAPSGAGVFDAGTGAWV